MKTGREGNTRQELLGPRANRGNKIQNGQDVNKSKCTELRLVLALAGILFQQNEEFQNLRLIICFTEVRKRILVYVFRILEKKYGYAYEHSIVFI